MFQKNKKGFFEFTDLTSLGLLNGVSTKSYGNLSYKYGQKNEVDANKVKFADDVGIDLNNTAQMSLVHGTNVQIVDKPGMYENVDGLITNTDVALWVLTGDCAPIILFDKSTKVVALVHSGWKGTVGKIALVALTKMITNFGSDVKNIAVAIGPSIEKCCYVKPKTGVTENLPEWKKFYIDESDNKMRVDLNGFTISLLKDGGVLSENIYYSNYCTKDHKDEFFCSQLEVAGIEKPGRFATVVKINDRF